MRKQYQKDFLHSVKRQCSAHPKDLRILHTLFIYTTSTTRVGGLLSRSFMEFMEHFAIIDLQTRLGQSQGKHSEENAG